MGSNQTLANNEPRDLLGADDRMRSLGFAPGQMTAPLGGASPVL
jgi:hypothetical protein